ncbi:glycoside hydrolase family 31 protein [Parvularcula marina]|uniref:DUF5110 domain-containing protein n=1 Tax=Parvularcula marina TaxID=2292771 RepID=A0A371RGJ7_9PROT|nr:TIM-barrel domain-containing protein [Parvularcula marina]RFB04583.1 DUF5110 domain-containing protein [Parvularcula marina]
MWKTITALTAITILTACGGSKDASSSPEAEEPQNAQYTVSKLGITVTPSASDAGMVRLEAISDTIFRVTAAAPGDDFHRAKSLMIDGDAGSVPFETEIVDGAVRLSTQELTAAVRLEDGKVTFLTADGEELLAENPSRNFTPTIIEGKDFFRIHQTFASDPDEGFYGLGQHQNGQMNFNGEDVELAQHNISIAMPFLVSTGDYGILWDNNSITRFGDPRPYKGLGESLIVRGADGSEGGLTGIYFKNGEIVAETRETDPDYQFLPPNQFETGQSVRDVFPAPLVTTSPDLVTWEGSIESDVDGTHKFRVYGSDYVKVWVDGELVVDRWRQNWNPYYFNFTASMTAGEPIDIRVEWTGNDGYFRMLHLDPMDTAANKQLSLSSEVADVIDYYFIHGENMDDVIAGYRELTGKSVMLPKWAYGFWQSRQRYTTQTELLDALQGYRDRNIPIDNIVLDWFYWPEDAWGSHEFDASRFPDPKAMVEAVHVMNARIMISVWPKFYPTTENFKELDKKGYISRGNLDAGALDWVGPGYLNAFYDPYPEEARKIFWRQMQENLDILGFDAWWMDATEPDMHSNLEHAERAKRMTSKRGSGEEYFNSFALPNARAVYEGERTGADPNKRVFILTRSAFPGLQRYGAAAWSGDIVARWDDLREQISAGVNMNMAGLSNWTFDIGGFSVEARYTTEDPAHLEEWRELNLRWFQFGSFAPLFRSHGEYPFREIYNLAEEGSEVYESLVYYDRLRYQLMPYIYTMGADLFHEDGTMMRGLVMDFENDRTSWDIADQYMFGDAFLVSPVHEFKARTRRLYLPAGADWYDFYTGENLDGGQWIKAAAPLSRMPLHVKAGSIVATGPVIQYTGENPDAPITLYIYTGADGETHLYEDDGTSYDYERGAYSSIPLHWNDETGTLTIGAITGPFRVAETRTFNVKWVVSVGQDGFSEDAEADETVTYSGEEITITR